MELSSVGQLSMPAFGIYSWRALPQPHPRPYICVFRLHAEWAKCSRPSPVWLCTTSGTTHADDSTGDAVRLPGAGFLGSLLERRHPRYCKVRPRERSGTYFQLLQVSLWFRPSYPPQQTERGRTACRHPTPSPLVPTSPVPLFRICIFHRAYLAMAFLCNFLGDQASPLDV